MALKLMRWPMAAVVAVRIVPERMALLVVVVLLEKQKLTILIVDKVAMESRDRDFEVVQVRKCIVAAAAAARVVPVLMQRLRRLEMAV